MRHFLAFTLRMLLDQRGEVGDDASDDEGELTDDDVVTIDPDELEDGDDDDPGKKGDDDPELEPETDFEAELAKRDELLKKQEETIKEHNRNLYGMRKKFKKLETKGDDKDAAFTDSQLVGMIEEHQDDPKVLLQVIKQAASQVSKGEAESQVKASEVSQRKKEMDDYLTSMYPDAYNEGSENHTNIQKAKEYMHITDHPLADSLAAAMIEFLQMPKTLEGARKEARESALKVEDNRKKTIKENSLETGKKKSAGKELSDNYRSTAKQLGLSKSQTKIYKSLLSKGNKPATVEV